METTAANISFAEHSRTSRFVRGLGLAIAVGTGYFLIDWVALGLWIEPHKNWCSRLRPVVLLRVS